MANGKRFRHEDHEVLQFAFDSVREHRHRPFPSPEYLQIEMLVDIRNLLYELNTQFAKIANPILIAQDSNLEKVDNSKLAVQPSHKAEKL